MKKPMLALITVIVLASCSSQELFNAFGKSDVITEIGVFQYMPIYSSYLPEPLRIIDKSAEISELTTIINHSISIDKKRKSGELMGGPGTFTYQIRFNGNSLTVSQVYILIEGDNVYISSLDLFDQSKKEYSLYQIQKADIDAFLGYLSESN